MNKLNILKQKEKKALIRELEELYGISEINYRLIEAGKKRLRAFSGNLNREEIVELGKITNIETIGIYFLSRKDAEPRINFDVLPLLKEQIKKNILVIDKEQFKKWLRGFELDLKVKRGTVVLQFEEDLVGIGKSNGEKIFNYLPKERKVR